MPTAPAQMRASSDPLDATPTTSQDLSASSSASPIVRDGRGLSRENDHYRPVGGDLPGVARPTVRGTGALADYMRCTTPPSRAEQRIREAIDLLERRALPAAQRGNAVHLQAVLGLVDGLLEAARDLGRAPEPRQAGMVVLTRATDGRTEMVHVSRLGQYYSPSLLMLRHGGIPPETRTVVGRRDQHGHPAGWMYVLDEVEAVCRRISVAEDELGDEPEAA